MVGDGELNARSSIEDKVEALALLLEKAVEVALEVEERVPFYMNARAYAHKLRVMIENALSLSKSILDEVKGSI